MVGWGHSNIALRAAPVLAFLRSVQDSYPQSYPGLNQGARTKPQLAVPRRSPPAERGAAAAKLTVSATGDIDWPMPSRARGIHDDVNGLRIVTCRSMTWPSCMSSEWRVLQFASTAAETMRES